MAGIKGGEAVDSGWRGGRGKERVGAPKGGVGESRKALLGVGGSCVIGGGGGGGTGREEGYDTLKLCTIKLQIRSWAAGVSSRPPGIVMLFRLVARLPCVSEPAAPASAAFVLPAIGCASVDTGSSWVGETFANPIDGFADSAAAVATVPPAVPFTTAPVSMPASNPATAAASTAGTV